MKYALATVALLGATLFQPAQAATAPSASRGEEASSVCDSFVLSTGDKREAVLSALGAQLQANACKQGDVVRVVTDGGLAWNIAPEAICDYRFHILLRPDSGLDSFSCVYIGSIRPWRASAAK